MKGNLRSAFNTRQYMQSLDFEAFYYSDLHFSTLPCHSHDYYEFYFFLEGDLSMEVMLPSASEGKERSATEPVSRRMQTGDMLLIPPGVGHHIVMRDSSVPYRRFVLWIGRDYANSLIQQSNEYGLLMQRAGEEGFYGYHFATAEFNAVTARMLRLLEEFHSNRYGHSPASRLALCDLVLYINRQIYEQEHPFYCESGDLLQALTLYIDDHLTEDLSLNALADHFYLSKYYISHCFKDGLGISIHQYIMKKRLSACADAIAAGADITRTFSDYGFQDYSAFFRAFKKEYGMSPKEYQEAFRSPVGLPSHTAAAGI